MIGEVCAELKNYFIRQDDLVFGDISILNGILSAYLLADEDGEILTTVSDQQIVIRTGPAIYPLRENQYFRIVGSRFNDGVHKYPASDLVDETFRGAVWPMRIPPDVISLAEDIEAWKERYGSADSEAMSPYSSESFGGYSYSKGSAASNSGQFGISWQQVFAERLKPYRRARIL